MRLCSVTGCGRRHWGRGYCQAHLRRLYELGDAYPDQPIQWSHGVSLAARRGGDYDPNLHIPNNPRPYLTEAEAARLWLPHVGLLQQLVPPPLRGPWDDEYFPAELAD